MNKKITSEIIWNIVIVLSLCIGSNNGSVAFWMNADYGATILFLGLCLFLLGLAESMIFFIHPKVSSITMKVGLIALVFGFFSRIMHPAIIPFVCALFIFVNISNLRDDPELIPGQLKKTGWFVLLALLLWAFVPQSENIHDKVDDEEYYAEFDDVCWNLRCAVASIGKGQLDFYEDFDVITVRGSREDAEEFFEMFLDKLNHRLEISNTEKIHGHKITMLIPGEVGAREGDPWNHDNNIDYSVDLRDYEKMEDAVENEQVSWLIRSFSCNFD